MDRVQESDIDQLFYFGIGPEDDWGGKIVGVTVNHHQLSLKESYDPIIFFPMHDYFGEYITLNIANATATIPYIQTQYEKLFPGNVFEYFFLGSYFNRQYEADQQFGKVFGVFSAVAVLVATLGLFGLTTFMITQRVKEIAIPRTLGANLPGMIYLFSFDTLMLIVIANIVALPLVYIAAKNWLNNFAFHVEIELLLFLIPTVVLLIISLTTTAYQTIKSASSNLIRSLQAEYKAFNQSDAWRSTGANAHGQIHF